MVYYNHRQHVGHFFDDSKAKRLHLFTAAEQYPTQIKQCLPSVSHYCDMHSTLDVNNEINTEC